THVEDDFLDPRAGEEVLHAQIAHERRGDLRAVAFAKAGRHGQALSSCSPQRRQVRPAWPSSRRRWPTRVGLLQRPQMGSTFETWIDASFSTMPPGCCTPRGFVWRFT